ncbi:hypothetical protein MMC30_004641 [Trapelia coarctata]|nr:hypothetical protein [Trapelia coarctata]
MLTFVVLQPFQNASLSYFKDRLLSVGPSLLDLWGRGYSSAPVDLPHDDRLYSTAILLALASSPMSWTGSSKFALVGYSMGGGIVANFTSCFPTLVSSLVLIAPSGLIREHHFSTRSRILYSTGFLPESVLEWAVRRRLKQAPATASAAKPKEPGVALEADVPEEKGFDEAILLETRPNVTVKDVVVCIYIVAESAQAAYYTLAAILMGTQDWQVNNHHGFVKSYRSSLRYAPISKQESDWKRIGRRLTAQKHSTAQKRLSEDGIQAKESGLDNGKVLIICGMTDPIIISEELMEDATKVLGVDNVQFETCDTGHELPITKSAEILEYMWDFWEGNSQI